MNRYDPEELCNRLELEYDHLLAIKDDALMSAIEIIEGEWSSGAWEEGRSALNDKQFIRDDLAPMKDGAYWCTKHQTKGHLKDTDYCRELNERSALPDVGL